MNKQQNDKNSKSVKKKGADDVIMNEFIRSSELRLIGEEGEQLGILSKNEALSLAETKGLDLVVISPDATPPVAKIMDYSKHKYQLEKKKKEAKKKQKIIEVKEIKFSPNIAENDIAYKVKHGREFLEQGKHLKLRVFLRGREKGNPQAGVAVLKSVWEQLKDMANLDQDAKLEGSYINMYVTPLKK
ncbi:MAG: translation initiation factor IF-3 [Sulfurovum sp. AS07-7]|nr:MAG: translation initiation factor IF-3 [Sulfurovum sp. AS07-7]